MRGPAWRAESPCALADGALPPPSHHGPAAPGHGCSRLKADKDRPRDSPPPGADPRTMSSGMLPLARGQALHGLRPRTFAWLGISPGPSPRAANASSPSSGSPTPSQGPRSLEPRQRVESLAQDLLRLPLLHVPSRGRRAPEALQGQPSCTVAGARPPRSRNARPQRPEELASSLMVWYPAACEPYRWAFLAKANGHPRVAHCCRLSCLGTDPHRLLAEMCTSALGAFQPPSYPRSRALG